jgi:type VI secretion system protein ImpM
MSGPALIPGTATAVAGWYGKIPALGDFASRRLPPGFINAWDAWLQRAMATSRAALRERWQEIYLNSPIWRFALLPGVCNNNAWAGIMMPSVDKVGRHFPLTIAIALDPQPEMITTIFASQDWFAAVEQIALSSLSMNFQVQELEDRLTASLFCNHSPADHPGHTAARELAAWWAGPGETPVVFNMPDLDSISTVIKASGLNMLSASGFGRSLWWTRDELTDASQMHAFSGLPPDNYFAILLAGIASASMSL